MRAAALFVLLALVAGCGRSSPSSPPPPSETLVDRTREVPIDVRAFLDRVTDEHTLAFTATYDVLERLGGEESTVEVEADPPDVTITAGEVVVVNGEHEAALSAVGVFSGFMTTGPAKAIEAAARRADAGPARFSSREAAGVRLDCIEIPVQGTAASTACLTPDGIFGFVDNPAVRYELTKYQLALTAVGSSQGRSGQVISTSNPLWSLARTPVSGSSNTTVADRTRPALPIRMNGSPTKT